MTARSAWASSRRPVTCRRFRARTCLPPRPSIELRSPATASSSRPPPARRHPGPLPRGQRALRGLDEHVLALGLVPDDGQVAVPLLAAAAAAELELRSHLVE